VANNELIAALLRGASGGIGGYRKAKEYNHQMMLESLDRAWREGQARQQQQNWQTQFGQQQKEFEYGQGQDQLAQDRWNRDKNWEAFKYTHEGAAKAMQQPGPMSESEAKAAMLLRALTDPSFRENPVYQDIYGDNTDPNIAANRGLEQRKKLGDILSDAIAKNRTRESGNYRLAGGTDETYKNAPPPTPTIKQGGFLGMGGEQVTNPLYQPYQNMMFWNKGNPAARDSAASLEGVSPLYRTLYGGGSQPGGSAQDNGAVQWLSQNIGDWDRLTPEQRQAAINRYRQMGGGQ